MLFNTPVIRVECQKLQDRPQSDNITNVCLLGVPSDGMFAGQPVLDVLLAGGRKLVVPYLRREKFYFNNTISNSYKLMSDN